MKKQKLLENLANNTYCRLMPSDINGIGVFAIKDIPKNVNPFLTSNKKPIEYNIIRLYDSDIQGLDNGVKKMLKDFVDQGPTAEDSYAQSAYKSPPVKNGNEYDVPYLGFNTIDISFYLNHSDKPNLDIIDNPKSHYLDFKTNTLIKKNKELFINYNKHHI